MMRSNSNYDIITINCNIMLALFILQIPTIILCTQCKTCSIDHCIGLAIEKYGCLAMKATAVYVILMSLKIIPNKIFLYVCYITIARIKWINKQRRMFFALLFATLVYNMYPFEILGISIFEHFSFDLPGFSIEIYDFRSKYQVFHLKHQVFRLKYQVF